MPALEWWKSLTLAQLERLFTAGKLTTEMLEETGLADKLWDLDREMENAVADPVFRASLRQLLMEEAGAAVPEDDSVEGTPE
jgi:hypothetical protein